MKSIFGFDVDIFPKGTFFLDPKTGQVRKFGDDEIYVAPVPTKKVTCPKCNGGGVIFNGADTLYTCQSCGGSGWAKFEIVEK
jgi:ribosomal protein S27AE